MLFGRERVLSLYTRSKLPVQIRAAFGERGIGAAGFYRARTVESGKALREKALHQRIFSPSHGPFGVARALVPTRRKFRLRREEERLSNKEFFVFFDSAVLLLAIRMWQNGPL
jgi:hypothetical protein